MCSESVVKQTHETCQGTSKVNYKRISFKLFCNLNNPLQVPTEFAESDHNTVSDQDSYDSDRDPEYTLPSDADLEEPQNDEDDALLSSQDDLEEAENDENDANTSKRRPKKGRKRKYLNLSRAENKAAKNTGARHFDHKGKIIAKKEFDELFRCTCTRKCYTKITNEERSEVFKKYWEL